MSTVDKSELTPAACLARLPVPTLDVEGRAEHEELRRVELRRSVLAIAELNHVNETTLVRAAVTNVRETLPSVED